MKLVQRFNLTVNICHDTKKEIQKQKTHFLTCSDSETQNLVLHTLCSIFHRQLSQSDLQKTNIHEYSGYNLVNMWAHLSRPYKAAAFWQSTLKHIVPVSKANRGFLLIHATWTGVTECVWVGRRGRKRRRESVCVCVAVYLLCSGTLTFLLPG